MIFCVLFHILALSSGLRCVFFIKLNRMFSFWPHDRYTAQWTVPVVRVLLNEADTFLLRIMNPPVTCALSLYMQVRNTCCCVTSFALIAPCSLCSGGCNFSFVGFASATIGEMINFRGTDPQGDFCLTFFHYICSCLDFGYRWATHRVVIETIAVVGGLCVSSKHFFKK